MPHHTPPGPKPGGTFPATFDPSIPLAGVAAPIAAAIAEETARQPRRTVLVTIRVPIDLAAHTSILAAALRWFPRARVEQGDGCDEIVIDEVIR